MVSQNNSKLKNTIVLRGMASNVVDEAIVLLKPGVKVKRMENACKFGVKEKIISRDLIMEEAENVIDEYIEKIQKNISLSKLRKLKLKLRILKVTNVISAILLICLVIMSCLG